METIVPARSTVSERFPIASFLVRVPPGRLYEVAFATDPRLFHTRFAGHRTEENFYSSREAGLLAAENDDSVFFIPPPQLRRFAGARRLFYALGTYGGRDGARPWFSITPDRLDAVPSIAIAPDFTGRHLRDAHVGRHAAASARYGGPRAGELRWGGDAALADSAATLAYGDVQSPNAPPRTRVGDKLGQQILDLLWEPLAESDLPGIRSRLRRLHALLDGVPDTAAGALLVRLEKGGDLYNNFEYRLHRSTRWRLRNKLKMRARPLAKPLPKKVPAPVPPPHAPFPVPPTPDPRKPDPPIFRPAIEYGYKTKAKKLPKLPKLKFLEPYLAAKFTATLSVKSSAADFAAAKLKIENGKAKGVLETQLQNDVVGDLKLEWEGPGKRPKLSSKRHWAAADLTFDLFLSTDLSEVLKLEITLPPLTFVHKFEGYDVSVAFAGTAILTMAVDWAEVLKDVIKRGIEDGLGNLFDDLLGWFWGQVTRDALFKAALLVLGVAILFALLDDDDDDEKEIDPKLVSRLDDAGPQRETLLVQAALHRHAFAKAFGDTISELTGSRWKERLPQLRAPFKVVGFVSLPSATAATAAWKSWAEGTAGRQQMEDVSLTKDDWMARMRRSELALLFATAASRLGQTNYANARQTAAQQASIAGMAAALQHVEAVLRNNDFSFDDESGRPKRLDGAATWEQILKVIDRERLSDKSKRIRFGKMGRDQLESRP